MKTRKTVSFTILILLSLLAAHSAFSAVGETYDQMIQRFGTPENVRIDRIMGSRMAARYEKAGAKAYIFKISGFKVWNFPKTRDFKVYALFNKDNVCFQMFTRDNRYVPDPSLFVGPLANTTPKILNNGDIMSSNTELQYGNGENAVIFGTSGYGTVNGGAISPALAPKKAEKGISHNGHKTIIVTKFRNE